MSDDLQQKPVASRVVSIDALRGFVMFWIVGGGNQGGMFGYCIGGMPHGGAA